MQDLIHLKAASVIGSFTYDELALQLLALQGLYSNHIAHI
jgi:hypothetical protein